MSDYELNHKFAAWAKDLSGCDGGNPKGRVWLCGIEWGGGHDPKKLDFTKSIQRHRPPEENNKILTNELKNRTYDINAFKLLMRICEGQPITKSNVKDFVKTKNPFTEGSSFFKANLYPISFKDTKDSRWDSDWLIKTGLPSKHVYRLWCWENRFPRLRQEANSKETRLILCVGKTYITDFLVAFNGLQNIHELRSKRIMDDQLSFIENAPERPIICILPFLTNKGNLTSTEKIQKFGDEIRLLCESKYGKHWL